MFFLALVFHAMSMNPTSGVCRYEWVAHSQVTATYYAACGLDWDAATRTGIKLPTL